ncbi:hypothetical protein IHE44_0012157 [Lamprotornis superbus]|uniref:Solute carrier family 23 member 1 n=1 Tax=Lamprotornis superbus TaxID=245042 RepID=A0A835NDX8_9PASS|nr:hypothetical protein IHE44_0012157 [Lamprotornis superbus]
MAIHTGADGQGKEKLLESAKMQHLTWHQAPIFKLLDQAHYATTENSVHFKERKDISDSRAQDGAANQLWSLKFWSPGNGGIIVGHLIESHFWITIRTPVGSRMVIIAGACAMLLSGIFGKVGAMLASIPIPVIGGMFLVMFGVITAVGISNLQYTDMNSSRNIFIFGFSLFAGLTIPNWASKNSTLLETGIIQLDQVILVLLTTGMFVGGLLGFILDNTIPEAVASSTKEKAHGWGHESLQQEQPQVQTVSADQCDPGSVIGCDSAGRLGFTKH